MTDFIPENPLEQAMLDAYNDESKREQFLAAFKGQLLFAVTPEAKEERVYTTTVDTPIQIMMMDFDGQPVFPLFTSPSRISECANDQVHFSGVDALTMLKMTASSPVVINPGTGLTTRLNINEVLHAIQPRNFEFDAGDTLIFGQAGSQFDSLRAALTDHFSTTKSVISAHFALAGRRPADGTPPEMRIVIALRVKDNFQLAFQQVAPVFLTHEDPEFPVIVLDLAADQMLAPQVEQAETLFRRKRFGFF